MPMETTIREGFPYPQPQPRPWATRKYPDKLLSLTVFVRITTVIHYFSCIHICTLVRISWWSHRLTGMLQSWNSEPLEQPVEPSSSSQNHLQRQSPMRSPSWDEFYHGQSHVTDLCVFVILIQQQKSRGQSSPWHILQEKMEEGQISDWKPDLLFTLKDDFTFWKEGIPCSSSVGFLAVSDPLLGWVRALLGLLGPWVASAASLPFPL